VHKSWNSIFFGGQEFSNQLNIAPYTYKLIRGIDFYRSFIEKIKSYSNVEFVKTKVLHHEEKDNRVIVRTEETTYSCEQLFNSIFDIESVRKNKKYPVLQQHFIGWSIKSQEPIFEPSQATFMDFSIEQKNNTRFMYVLPFSKNTALIEYTLFSEHLLPKKEYEDAIREYLSKKLGCTTFEILEQEKGSIPMTCYKFHELNTKRIQYIGTAGGWSKPSTGYTFYNTSKNTRKIVQLLKEGKSISKVASKKKFWFYDLLLLDILYKHNKKGQYIFETLFKNRPPQLIFKFLDEETNFWEDLRIISGCPKKEFLNACLERVIRGFK
ncbi:MAG: lycopene cyclase, partial [Maribacter sp.]|nr:lycopene cyclase [Maribacter sp.]